jgi:hypothetical protein
MESTSQWLLVPERTGIAVRRIPVDGRANRGPIERAAIVTMRLGTIMIPIAIPGSRKAQRRLSPVESEVIVAADRIDHQRQSKFGGLHQQSPLDGHPAVFRGACSIDDDVAIDIDTEESFALSGSVPAHRGGEGHRLSNQFPIQRQKERERSPPEGCGSLDDGMAMATFRAVEVDFFHAGERIVAGNGALELVLQAEGELADAEKVVVLPVVVMIVPVVPPLRRMSVDSAGVSKWRTFVIGTCQCRGPQDPRTSTGHEAPESTPRQ